MDEVTLNDLLECSVCLDRLDTSSKVLPCQHTFCKKCLEEIVQKHKELRCPECRILVTIKVDDLPPNVLLMRILEGMKNAVPKLQQRNVRGQQHQQQQTQMHHQMMQAVSHHHQHHGGVGGGTPDRKAGGQNKHGTSSSPHNVLPHQPYAKALYDYDSKEPGDLSFKRGDIIFLRKRIDAHWFQGECGGRQGLFPLSYVQVITPLPSLVPQCKALYDFQTDKHEEEGCLVFKEGDVINVIRRVDENWAEGKLDGRIGIFPLTFVELNNLARSLMKLSTKSEERSAGPKSGNSQPGPSRVAPPTPTTEESTTPLIPTDHSRLVIVPQQPQQQPQQQNNLLLLTANQGNHSVFGGTLPLPHQQPLLLPQQQTPVHHHQQQQQQQQQAPATAANLIRLVPISDSIGSSSSSSTTTTTTPNVSSTSNTSSSSASNSSTAPSSPASPPTAAAAVALPRNIPKPELPSLSPAQRSPNAGASTASSLGNHHSESGATRPSVHGGLQNKEKRHSLTNISPTPIVGNLQSTSSSSSHHPHHRHSAEILTSGAAAEALPMMGPQNSGHHSSHNTSSKRSVTVSNAGDSSGDPKLPAAYVALYPYKPQKADELGLRKGAVYMVTERCQDGWYKGTSSRTHKCGVFPGNYVTYLGPKPCPAASSRDGDGSSTVSSSSATASGVSFTRAGKSNANPTSKSNNSSSCNASLQRQACTNNNLPPPELPPRSVSPAAAASSSSANASISASWHGNAASASPQPHQESVAVATAPLGRSTSAIMPSTASSSSPTTTHNNGSVATASATTKPADKTKDRKEKGTVGLMRRLTSIKRSKSPPAASTYSMDNPVFEDSSVSVTTATAHPVHVRSGSCPSQLLQIQPPSAAEHHRMLFGGSTSQRLKHKERPSVLTHSIRTADQQNPNSSTAAGGTASSNPTSTNHPNRHHHHHTHNHHQHRKSNSLDAGGIGSGGISSNRGATLAAQSSAAMKTAVMTVNNELFRCEIPYPPNSEYELELQKNDLIYVHKKRDDGWYKGTLQRTGRTGLFPASFVKPA